MVRISEQRQYVNALIASFGAMTIGMALGWSSPLQHKLLVDDSFKIAQKDVNMYGPILCFGGVLGALLGGIMMKWISYRYLMIIYDAILILNWSFLEVADDFKSIASARFSLGVGVGALSAIIPTYIGEISQPHVRGKMIAMYPVFIAIGILWSYVVGSMAQYFVFNALSGMCTVIHMVGVFFLPESPYYLLKKGKDDDAYQSMMKLRDGNPANVTEELSIMKDEIQTQENRSLMDFGTIKSVLISCGCMYFIQINGVFVITFFMHDIVKKYMHEVNEFDGAVIVGLVQVIVTVLVASITDKISRKKLLIISTVLTFFCAMSPTISFADFKPEESSVLLILITLQVSAFSLGLSVVPWIIMGEIFSTKMKPYGTTLTTITYWLVGFIALYAYVHELSVTKPGSFIFCLLGVLFFHFFIPEMRNKTLGEIQSNFTGTISTTSTTSTAETSNNADA